MSKDLYGAPWGPKDFGEVMKVVGTKDNPVSFAGVSDEVHCNIKSKILKKSEAREIYDSASVVTKQGVCSLCFYKCFN